MSEIEKRIDDIPVIGNTVAGKVAKQFIKNTEHQPDDSTAMKHTKDGVRIAGAAGAALTVGAVVVSFIL